MNLLVRLSFCLGMGCLAAVPMHADTFTSYVLSDANDRNLVGIDSSGDVLIFNLPVNKYELYSAGMLVSSSDARPSFTLDNGTSLACTGPTGSPALCNGVRQVYSDSGEIYEVSPDTTLFGDVIGSGFFDLTPPGTPDVASALNFKGDFVYVDGHDELIREIAVASTPEPSSLVLLATGLGTVATTLQRRRRQSVTQL